MELAVPLGLMLNELITNSYKYAFLNHDNLENKISISLIVKDNGKGLPDDFNVDNLSLMASYKLLICLLFLFVNAQFGFTQHNINAQQLDSLQRVVANNKDSQKTSTALLTLSTYYAEEDTKNLDSLFYYANKTLAITKGNTELEEQNVDALYYLAYHAYKTEQIDNAETYNAQVKSISEKLIYGMGLRNASLLSGFISEKENKPNLAIFNFENDKRESTFLL